MAAEAPLELGPAAGHLGEVWNLIWPNPFPIFRGGLQFLFYEIFPEMHSSGYTDPGTQFLGPPDPGGWGTRAKCIL